jgi:hypothetical protein
MIISASYRSDIPAFYRDWFVKRRAAGFARVANPYGGQPYKVPLRGPDVDGFVFWTRNPAPFMATLADLHGEGVPFVVHVTLTGYPRDLETSVPGPDQAVALMHEIANRFGPRVLVWRYDPLLFTMHTPPRWHRETFSRLTAALAGACDEVCLSFAHIYRKTARNLEAAGIAWRDPEVEEKAETLRELSGLAAENGMTATVCSQPELGLVPARCIDAGRLSDVAGRTIAARQKGNREGCLCAESRDIGAYDSCPHGCRYCYAVAGPAVARKNHRRHDPAGEMLLPSAQDALP